MLLRNFGRECPKVHSYEVTTDSNNWLQMNTLLFFYIRWHHDLVFNQVKVILAILIENHPIITHVKYHLNRQLPSNEYSFKRFSIIWPSDLIFNRINVVFSNFGRKSHNDHFYEVLMSLDNWFQRDRLLKAFT